MGGNTKALQKRGISVCDEFIYFKNKPTDEQLFAAPKIVISVIQNL